MAVMCRFTLKTDVETYQTLHGQTIGQALLSGLLFHSAHEVGSHIGIVDFWPSAEAFQQFMEGTAGEGMKANGIAAPDDVQITPLLNADSP